MGLPLFFLFIFSDLKEDGYKGNNNTDRNDLCEIILHPWKLLPEIVTFQNECRYIQNDGCEGERKEERKAYTDCTGDSRIKPAYDRKELSENESGFFISLIEILRHMQVFLFKPKNLNRP
jgi:hypothetical protein